MSLCDNCIHDEVCGLEANHDDGLIFCDDMIPSVMPKQRTGHWIESRCDMYECSECDHIYTDLSGERYGMNYCPNCGAKMESEVSDADSD